MADPATTADTISPAKARIVDAAASLFARQGVGGTSLQMIADEIGVTKAAVYHQFNAKEAIVLAVAEAELDRVRAVIERAEQQDDHEASLDVMISGVVDLAVQGRHSAGTVLNDPAVTGYFVDHEPFRDVMRRMRRLLIGPEAGPEAQVRTAMLIAALSGAATSPMVAGLDDDVLRTELLRLARRFISDQ